MFQITDKIATHGLGESHYPETFLSDGLLDETDFWIVDVRDMEDWCQPLEVYERTIQRAITALDKNEKIVICCGAGQSRSNAVALGVLMQKYNMDFYDAYNLIMEKVPIAQIDPFHINALKKMFKVGLP
jgi:protein-tyrosine phosphatase